MIFADGVLTDGAQKPNPDPIQYRHRGHFYPRGRLKKLVEGPICGRVAGVKKSRLLRGIADPENATQRRAVLGGRVAITFFCETVHGRTLSSATL